jgi:hypothetical protein
VVDANDARALYHALAPHYAGDAAALLRLDVVEGLPHVINKPGDIARVRTLANAWFLRFMQGRGQVHLPARSQSDPVP